ncbi:MAG: threonine synthase [Wolinella sp.]
MLIETRGNDNKKPKNVSFDEAILSPGASFGGLYAPESLPKLDDAKKEKLRSLSYAQLCKEIFKLLDIQLDEQILNSALELYKDFDDSSTPAPLTQLEENLAVMELYHGKTRAFKDMALQPFGAILSSLASARGEEYLILAATSGDTGPATLESFANKPNIRVVCLYPHGGTSDVQRLQMTTQSAKNLKVIGIHGDFDDAQAALKSLLQDSLFIDSLNAKNIKLSAANSVNFGRIAFQIIYHAYAALHAKNRIDIIVPSGNFGNALGAFYAKLMGFDIGKIIIASNANNILTELLQTGIYDIRGRKLQKTSSPAMDILKSSNVERVLFALFGADRTRELMENLEREGIYTLNSDELAHLQEFFGAVYCDDSGCEEIITKYAARGYLLDPHTACGMKAYEAFKCNYAVLCSTAEWTKFAPTVARALGGGELRDLDALHFVSSKQNSMVNTSVSELFKKPEVHKNIVDKSEIRSTILSWL